MAYSHTTTYTYYWLADDEHVQSLRQAYRELHDDYERRRPFIDADAASAMLLRLDNLCNAISLLLERIPE